MQLFVRCTIAPFKRAISYDCVWLSNYQDTMACNHQLILITIVHSEDRINCNTAFFRSQLWWVVFYSLSVSVSVSVTLSIHSTMRMNSSNKKKKKNKTELTCTLHFKFGPADAQNAHFFRDFPFNECGNFLFVFVGQIMLYFWLLLYGLILQHWTVWHGCWGCHMNYSFTSISF